MEILKKNNVTTIIKDEGRPFKILQLTDIHLGAGWVSSKKDKLALQAVKKLIDASNPDFIVITGDMFYPIWPLTGSANNLRGAKMLGNVLKEAGKPWCFVFGNHDTEMTSRANKDGIADYYMQYENCLFEKGEESLTGCGNYCIRLETSDGKPCQLLMMIDSNQYTKKSFFSGFDVIHEDQIEWYKKTVKEQSGDGELLPSLAFYHIPPKEFKEGWEKCFRGDKDVIYHHGFVLEKDNYFGYPKETEGKFFSEMVEFGSCKGMFMGHDHLNTLSITYQGIRLTYGMSIDYLAYVPTAHWKTQRGGTIIEINDDGSFEVTPLPLVDIE